MEYINIKQDNSIVRSLTNFLFLCILILLSLIPINLKAASMDITIDCDDNLIMYIEDGSYSNNINLGVFNRELAGSATLNAVGSIDFDDSVTITGLMAEDDRIINIGTDEKAYTGEFAANIDFAEDYYKYITDKLSISANSNVTMSGTITGVEQFVISGNLTLSGSFIGDELGDYTTQTLTTISVGENATFTVTGNISNASKIYVTGELILNSADFDVKTINQWRESTSTIINSKISSSSVYLYENATMHIVVSQDNTFTNEETFSFNNDGKLILSATATDIKKTQTEDINYTLSALTDTSSLDYGDVLTYGGTFDDNIFTISTAENYDTATLSIAGVSNAIIGSDSNVIISTSSMSNSGQAMKIYSAKDITSDVSSMGDYNSIYEEISDSIQSDFTVLSSWNLDVELTDLSDSVVVSFLVGEGYDLSKISLYLTDSESTEEVSSSIFNYEDGYLSFIANSLDGNTAIVAIAIPESSTYAIIFGGIALGLAMYRRRR